MDIYEALSRDHREFERLLDELLAASQTNDERWKSRLDELRRGVIAHAHAEEAVFYNSLRECDQAKGVVMHSYAEHAAAEGEIRALGAAKLVDKNWPSLVQKLSDDLRHHIQEEESRVFDAARQVLSAEEAAQLGAAFERMKAESTANDGDSMVASTIDLLANLLPPRFTAGFRQHWMEHGHTRAAEMAESSRRTLRSATKFIGGASVVSGAAAIFAPRAMADLFGMPRALMRPFGVRDIAIGVALLARPDARAALLARGLSDGLDTGIIARSADTRHGGTAALVGRIAVGALLAAFSLARSASV